MILSLALIASFRSRSCFPVSEAFCFSRSVPKNASFVGTVNPKSGGESEKASLLSAAETSYRSLVSKFGCGHFSFFLGRYRRSCLLSRLLVRNFFVYINFVGPAQPARLHPLRTPTGSARRCWFFGTGERFVFSLRLGVSLFLFCQRELS